MKKQKWILLLNLMMQTLTFAESESMRELPILQKVKIYPITTQKQGNDLQEERGFGNQEPENRMMNLMMVGGSGYEGMDMEEMKSTTTASAPPHSHHASALNSKNELIEIRMETELHSIRKGSKTLIFTLIDSKTQRSISGLKPKASVFMTNMDMGTEFPKVNEVKPGYYQMKAPFSMQGPWAVEIELKDHKKVFEINVQK